MRGFLIQEIVNYQINIEDHKNKYLVLFGWATENSKLIQVLFWLVVNYLRLIPAN